MLDGYNHALPCHGLMLGFFDGLRKNDTVTSRGPDLHGIEERKIDRRVTELVI